MLCKCGCGREVSPPKVKFFSDACSSKYHNGRRKRGATSKPNEKSWRRNITTHKPKPKRQLMTDEQQRKIDKAVDKKFNVECACRTLKGAEFRRVAAELIERERRLGKRLEMRG